MYFTGYFLQAGDFGKIQHICIVLDAFSLAHTPQSSHPAFGAGGSVPQTFVDPEILAAVEEVARTEGRQIQALIDEALADLLHKRMRMNTRPHVVAACMQSHETYASAYEKLAE